VTEGADNEAYTIRAIDRAVDVLQAFTHEKPSLSLAEIADHAGLSKPTAFRFLANLKRRGFVEQDGERGLYSLGFELVTLADVRKQQTKVWDIALPYLGRIRDAVDETVLLCTRVNDERYVLDQVESSQAIRRVARIGERVPLYAGAASRILLAAMSDAEIDEYFERTALVRLGPSTITDPDVLRKQVEWIREHGYAVGSRERNFGGGGIAVGVRDYTGEVVAALQVTIPVERLTDEVRAKALEALVLVGHDLSSALGHRGPGPTMRDIGQMVAHLPPIGDASQHMPAGNRQPSAGSTS
jgi:IclR family transcriptional regulator, KDG regulon repressor